MNASTRNDIFFENQETTFRWMGSDRTREKEEADIDKRNREIERIYHQQSKELASLNQYNI